MFTGLQNYNTLPLHRIKASYDIQPATAELLKTRMLNWANQFNILVFLDNNNYPSTFSGYECLLAAGARKIIENEVPDPLSQIQMAHYAAGDWLFGHICYDYKNILEPRLTSSNAVILGYPLLQFFVPQTVCYVNRELDKLVIETFDNPLLIYDEIMSASGDISECKEQLSFTQTTTKEAYLKTIGLLRQHIADGDCYEVNYCNAAYCEDVTISPLAVFNALNRLSPAPFAAYYRLNELHMMCASPERFIRKEGSNIVSQPIKGTARRDSDTAKDELIKEALRYDIKERAENVMIVDLVRNDLARCCLTGSVKVDELFGIFTFPQVHQMISTVSGTLQAGKGFTEAIRATFPMGSMTGAPKHKVMQLIDSYEPARRELFSGTIGYISPSGDFDFNVIIRSLFYNSQSRRLSYATGGAITFDSDADKEWEEMRLKAWALERIFFSDDRV